MKINRIALFVLLGTASMYGQELKLDAALKQAIERYDLIKVKEARLAASQENTTNQKGNYFPDLTFGAQQSYGTINAQNGPLYAYGGLGSAATSMPLAEQNWNAAFGSLYFANVNWNIFSFGKTKEGVTMAKAQQEVNLKDLEQEVFQQQVKVSATYLNLLATQRIKYVQQKNLERAKVFHEVTAAKAKSGLLPQVDERLAMAEVANAEVLHIKAYDKEIEFNKQLAVLLDEDTKLYQLDDVFVLDKPQILEEEVKSRDQHPMLLLQESKIAQSESMERLVTKGSLPTLNGFGVLQGRGSGFDYNYVQDNSAYSTAYGKGVGIDRGNYLVGLQLTWNVSNFFRTTYKRKQQEYITKSYEHEFLQMDKELANQVTLTKEKYANAQAVWTQSKIQLEAAEVAFKQQKALYDNGLSNLVDFTQALYTLQRAEIDYEIAQNNVWQSLLLQASAHGDIQYLLNAIPLK
ncbi:TolC family protein [Myroides marinus]|uniref:TolC family protein n=1 Tax=Myroides marinus TaxID=703342 RepID=UPI0025779D00|nr:TolC family protein [Myroides marinus]MDM1362343.1 TolC family protein [Myroides marinus]MDM1375521.1 TolC family protein [Myroides marinus]MDM1532786.1 TolC family protein [Myroides marinus]MDM1539784.1 TolC family protein [Myroides marinus]